MLPIKARLGHKPSSDVIDAYVSYLAIPTEELRREVYQGNLEDINKKNEELEEQLRTSNQRIEELQEKIKNLTEDVEGFDNFYESEEFKKAVVKIAKDYNKGSKSLFKL